jgi:3-isopropylmalate/(R)-2-methylmalate dehydratase small subunit
MSLEPLRTVTGAAVAVLRPNIDTDVIIRVERMVSTNPDDLAPWAFEALRRNDDGTDDPTCALNDPRFAGAPILLAGPNFGCGSSREPAVWAVQGLGIRCIIAPSYGDIFRANCHQNGILPIVLAGADVDILAILAADATPVTVDLAAQNVTAAGRTWTFDIGAIQKRSLLEGLDDLDLAMADIDAIRAWEHQDRTARSWAWTPVQQSTVATGDAT